MISDKPLWDFGEDKDVKARMTMFWAIFLIIAVLTWGGYL